MSRADIEAHLRDARLARDAALSRHDLDAASELTARIDLLITELTSLAVA
jgi:hypothetical protein